MHSSGQQALPRHATQPWKLMPLLEQPGRRIWLEKMIAGLQLERTGRGTRQRTQVSQAPGIGKAGELASGCALPSPTARGRGCRHGGSEDPHPSCAPGTSQGLGLTHEHSGASPPSASRQLGRAECPARPTCPSAGPAAWLGGGRGRQSPCHQVASGLRGTGRW